MDPHAVCQDILRCDVCDNDIAELFCVCCDINLCRKCIGGHLGDDPEKHNIVKNIEKYTTLIIPLCAIHSEGQCKNYCQQCDLAVCSSCISSKSHVHHKFLNIEEIFKRKKGVIKHDLDELEQEIFPSYEEIVEHVEFNGDKLEETFEGVLSNIEEQRKIWHQELDLRVKALIDDVGGMRKMQMKAQSNHLKNLQGLLLKVKQSIQRNKDLLESLEISKSLSYDSINSTLRRLPPRLEISVPRFIPQSIEDELNSEKIGVITGFCISYQEEGYQLKSQSGVDSRGNRNENGEKISKEFLKKPQIMTTVETKLTGPKNVACTNDRNLWVANDVGLIQLFKLSDSAIDSPEILKSILALRGRKSIAVTKRGDLLLGRIFSNTISIYKENETNELVNLNSWSLLSLCNTASNGILVCMTDSTGYACRVVRFEESEERQIIQYDNAGKRLFAPGKARKQVRENCNGDVCVADYNGRAVVVTDKKGTFRFRYKIGLYPEGVVTDTQAQLIIPHERLIHIIDKDGHFICFLKFFSSWNEEVGLDIDNEDNLYLAEINGTVKIIRYMKKNKRIDLV